MEEKRYIISEAAQKTGIEAHVLRYWEDELGLYIPRNEMGHRYYTDRQLNMFRHIKDLKDSGFQLKAVKTVIDSDDDTNIETENSTEGNSMKNNQLQSSERVNELEMKKSEDKLAQFEQIISDIVTRSLMANNVRLGQDISGMVSDNVSTKVIKEMDYMMRVREESEDDRFKKLDETIRGLQKNNKEAALLRDNKIKKKKRFFK